MKLKRIAAAVLGACMAVCNVPATVRAEEALPKDNTEAGKKYALCVGVNDYDPSYVGRDDIRLYILCQDARAGRSAALIVETGKRIL